MHHVFCLKIMTHIQKRSETVCKRLITPNLMYFTVSVRGFHGFSSADLGVSKNNGTPKWMVKIMKNPIKMDDLGGPPLFLETSIWPMNQLPKRVRRGRSSMLSRFCVVALHSCLARQSRRSSPWRLMRSLSLGSELVG